MKFHDDDHSWRFLEAFRGTEFHGQWPTLPELFNISTKRFPKHACWSAFSPTYESFTFTEAREKMLGFASYLLSLGLKKGDKVGVTGKNSPEWAIAYLGTMYAGCIAVPLDWSFHDSEMEKLIAFAELKVLCIDKERIHDIDKEGKLALVKISLEPGDPDHPFILDCMAAPVEHEMPTEEDLAAILFTSGTTGTPKGVMLTHKNFVSDCFIAQSQMDIGPDDVFYAILPIHHAYTMLAVLIESLSVGAGCVFGKRLVISQVFKEIHEGGVTMFLGVPMLFNKLLAGLLTGVKKKSVIVYGVVRCMMAVSGMLKHVFHINVGKKWFGFLLKNIALDKVRICISGGGPLPASTFRMYQQLGLDFVQGYGLTETSPIATLNPTYAFVLTSVGRYFPQEEIKICNPDGDGNGVIYIKGPNVMKGYYKNPEATAEVLSEDGWLNTGDVGHLDKHKYLYLTGRERNIIVTEGGKNVFPEEIEDLFQLYDEIDTICVIGYMVDKQLKTEGVRALVYPAKNYLEEMQKAHPQTYKQEIQKHFEEIVGEVNRTLQPYKKITRVTTIWEPLPKSSTMKVKRFLVRQQYQD